jgi:hypothetical protein
MKTVSLVTSDDRFHLRLARALSAEALIVRWGSAQLSSEIESVGTSVLILDCRETGSTVARETLLKLRLDRGVVARAIALVGRAESRGIHVVTMLQRQALDVILPDLESVEDVIRTHLNDATQTTGAAMVLELMLAHLPIATHETSRAVLGSGFRVNTVKRLATLCRRDRTTIGKTLRKATPWTANEVIRVAKACYSAVALRESPFSRSAVCTAIGYSQESSLEDLLFRLFGMRSHDLVRTDPDAPAYSWLERKLLEVVAAHGESRP